MIARGVHGGPWRLSSRRPVPRRGAISHRSGELIGRKAYPGSREKRPPAVREFHVRHLFLRFVFTLSAAVALSGAAAAPAVAEEGFFQRLFCGTTATAPAAPAGPGEWSGQSGASGHPLMTREAILAAAANFRGCIDRLWPEAQRRGISRASFETHTAALMPDLKIMDLVDSQ